MKSFSTISESCEAGEQVCDALRSRTPLETALEKLIFKKWVCNTKLSLTCQGLFVLKNLTMSAMRLDRGLSY